MEYYLCSNEVVNHFPDLEKSNSFKSGYDWDIDSDYFVISVDDYKPIDKYYKEVVEPYNEKSNCPIDFWLRPVCGSTLDSTQITLKQIRKIGLFLAIENELNLTKETNRAFAIYSLSQKYNCTPIDFINKITYQ